MNSLTVSSPAKLNLYLRILGKRPDGYHDIHTLFHRVSLCDRLVLRKRKAGFYLKCDQKNIPADERNLITKAYRLLEGHVSLPGGVSVQLDKKIPAGAGLGGGSSNAASFLLGMNRLYKLNLSQRSLLRLGSGLGADVPFFLKNVTQAAALGKGERLYPRPSKRRHRFLLLISIKELSTKDVYAALRPEAFSPSLTKGKQAVRMLCNFLDWEKNAKIAPLMQNDLESAAFKLRPSIRRQIEKLNHLGVEAVRMSGSGPTVFILLPRQTKEEKRLVARVRRHLPLVATKLVQTC